MEGYQLEGVKRDAEWQEQVGQGKLGAAENRREGTGHAEQEGGVFEDRQQAEREDDREDQPGAMRRLSLGPSPQHLLE